jgi:UDP-N-acetylmuramate dehydrogenase
MSAAHDLGGNRPGIRHRSHPDTDPAQIARAVDIAAEILGAAATRSEPLAPLTTYRVGGPAALFVRARSVGDLERVAAARRASGLPVLVVGRGSNLLVADGGFAGIAVAVAELAGGIDLPDDASEPVVTAGGGVALPVLARRSAAAGLSGLEWAVGVPGSVGGAVRMNAGGHGSDIAACLLDVDVFDLSAPEPTVVTMAREAIGLRFRGSDLTDDHVVVSARLGVSRGDRAAAEATIAEIVRWRREHQPGGQNCGSVFVNPVPGEVSAGSLVDGLGLRGFRIGTAWVSEKHANFVQASEGGSAADVRAVIEAVRRRVAEATGFWLRSEVRLVGFDGGAG